MGQLHPNRGLRSLHSAAGLLSASLLEDICCGEQVWGEIEVGGVEQQVCELLLRTHGHLDRFVDGANSNET